MAKRIFIAWWRYDQLTESNQVKSRHRNDLINVNGVALMSFWSMFIKFNRLFRSSRSQPKACDFAKKRLQCKSFSLSFAKFFRTVFVVVYVAPGHLRATAFTSSSTFIEWNFKHGFTCYVRFYIHLTLVGILSIEELIT